MQKERKDTPYMGTKESLPLWLHISCSILEFLPLSQMDLLKSMLVLILVAFIGCFNGESKLLDECSSDSDCEAGLYCFSCSQGFSGSRCVRSAITDQFKLLNNSLPFNKYAYLTTHNSYAIDGEPSHTGVPRNAFTNQEDTVTQQLNNGVRALMLDTYDFKDDVWLCHSSGGKCFNITAFEPAIDTMKEIEAFLSTNPSEIVTLILEDYVQAANGLTKVFNESGLLEYWFPVSNMPQNGEDWPLVHDMVSNNHRLIVFTSIESKQDTEGIAYQWNYMVENQWRSATRIYHIIMVQMPQLSVGRNPKAVIGVSNELQAMMAMME
ncbi:PI-PLC X domain-containing protein At5g67130-like isoform X2 [Phoenix dactylifera]|uniref:PI-PLC X domain-containing protein At5g67130-like isoform X2 n=1 Tax=Phoenix dactylifera TaxID=42345 RepID=A0A8B9ADM3_PHODC|nr:PI-PLC X domain-containing protein At5g67130-like isoform X2 [Phoenix dactylifera]